MIKTSRILSIILTLIIASASWTGAKAQYGEAKGGRPAIVGNFYYLLFDSESGTNTAILTDKEYAGTAAGSNSYSGTVIIPESFQTENANHELATYTVIGIDDYAFYGSTGLIKVDIPKTVVSIGKMVFDGCTSLQKISVNPENQSFCAHDDVLYNFAQTELIVSAKTKTGKFIVPEDVKKINEFAFHDCENITEIVLPNGLKEIGKAAFWGCTNMTSINIPTSLTTLGSDAFRDDSSLSSSITIPATVSIIDSNAFRDCRKISSVTIADGVTEIGEYAFNGCSKITSIELPASINLLGSSSFAETGLTSISIPYSITNIPSSAFANCKLTSITLPKNLQTIGEQAFANNGTSIQEVEIPESVTSISSNAFNGTNVSNFYINNIPSKIAIGENSPFNTSGVSIHIFTKMKSIFENATNWSNYKGHFVADIEITHVEFITLDNTNMTVLTGATGKLNATINPEDARIKDVVYTSSDPNLILIDSATGVFSAGANEGDATVTCTAADGSDVFAECKITVKKSFVPATSVTLNKTNASMEVGGSLSLTATINPTNATFKNVVWISDNEDVATVSKTGNLTAVVNAVGPGSATITAISQDGAARAKCTVTVTYGGSCGKDDPATGDVDESQNVVWMLTGNTLTISGTGAMADYAEASGQPWTAMHSDINAIVIEDGVTSIGKYAFSNCEEATSVSIPASVTSIGNNAFDGCSNLATVTLNSNPFIGESAFYSSTAVTMNLTANGPVDGAYWTTFYNKNYSFQTDANTQVFKAALSGTTLTLTELATDQIVNKNNAVILKSTASPIVMTLTTDGSNDFTGNSLQGVDNPAGLTAADPSTTYVLNNGSNGVGFYKLKAGSKLGVGKAYLTYTGTLAPGFFGFDEGTTGITNTDFTDSTDKVGAWYTLSGVRLNAKPTQKGLYIVNGKKIMIK